LQDYEFLINFLIAVVSGIIGAYFGHLFSVRQVKKKDFIAPMRQLYGISCKIMEKTDAEKLDYLYNKLIQTTIEEKKREIALRDLHLKDSKFRLELGPLAMAQINFWHSYSCLIDVVEECRHFEKEYSNLEKSGLIQSLKKHHKGLYSSLWDFESYSNTIVEHTKGLGDKIIRAYELENDHGLETILKEENFEVLQSLSIAISNLFRSGSQLQKQLEKII
jgi:hypothetical protein